MLVPHLLDNGGDLSLRVLLQLRFRGNRHRISRPFLKDDAIIVHDVSRDDEPIVLVVDWIEYFQGDHQAVRADRTHRAMCRRIQAEWKALVAMRAVLPLNRRFHFDTQANARSMVWRSEFTQSTI